ncbi:hypothetical protein Val02_93010 [Virgisporangium aliadipatigenens]|uniref:Uncharacterized protein n=1 Tax=Virgisporangium aliadipatigenens TaxID=741659 RepID=A0A8J3YZA1_9ACTN|nr:hypothetical protein [Virgisporangium aliadipatigenens]GIJ52415.1 hypothetical protein Val02_93010 [Virgisporangium aliadipatigenens]
MAGAETVAQNGKWTKWRHIAGLIAAWLAGIMLVLSVLGVWNPPDLVLLWRFFGNPFRDAVVVFGLGVAASWLLAPVQNEAVQRSRVQWRIGLAVGLVASLIAVGLFDGFFVQDHRVVATSPDGERRAVLYDPGTDLQRLHLWVGPGLFARDFGDLGKPCGMSTITFRGNDVLHVWTSYGEWDIKLKPDTGRPLAKLGRTCSG